nr:uncharacterized protein LOC108083758 [Drosophila kikkawai]
MCRQAVWDWLVLLTMEKYVEKFLEHGYDCIAQCKLIIHSDLVMLGVDNVSHRKLLLHGVQLLTNSPEFTRLESCELHCLSEREKESLFEGSTAANYFELSSFLDKSGKLDEASLLELPKIPLIVGTIGSPDQDILPVMPGGIKCGETIEIPESYDSNCIPFDYMYKYC